MSDDTYRRLQKKAFAICRNAGLGRNDRLDFAREILGTDVVTSFNDLSLQDMQDLCFGLEAWDTVQKIREANGSLMNEAKILVKSGMGYSGLGVEPSEAVLPLEAVQSASEDVDEDPEPESTDEPVPAPEPSPDEDDEPAAEPEIPSEFASVRKSRKRG